jgi:hypothetical protein
MAVGYENHCGDSVRCDVCPINLLTDYQEQTRASELVKATVNEAAYGHMRHAKVSEIRGMARQTIGKFLRPSDEKYLGILTGALVLTATGECTSLYEGDN